MDVEFDFDQQITRLGSNSYKWDGLESVFGRSDILPFWVADMDFASPPAVLAAIRKRTDHPVMGYGHRSDEYYSAIQGWLKTRHGWEVPQEWLMFCPPSSIVGIHGIVESLSAPGDSIVAPTPTYGALLALIEQNGRRLIRNPLREVGRRFELDIEDMEAKLCADTKMVMFCSPNNPLGRVFTRAELESLAKVAERHDLVVVSDEVHCDLIMPGHRHLPYGLIGGERSVTVISPNKTFNTAGMPQATLIIPDFGIRAKFRTFLDRMQLNHDSTFGAICMITAYQQCAPWLDSLIAYLDENHRTVDTYLAERVPSARKVAAEATYLAWLDFRQTGLEQAEIMERLVRVGGVGLYGGTEFGTEGDGFFRMNLACSKAQLLKGLAGISKALA